MPDDEKLRAGCIHERSGHYGDFNGAWVQELGMDGDCRGVRGRVRRFQTKDLSLEGTCDLMVVRVKATHLSGGKDEPAVHGHDMIER